MPGSCADPSRVGSPARFAVDGVDTSPYLMPQYEAASFPSRDGSIQVRATSVRGAWPEAPTVVVHGQWACRHDPSVLLPAGMLRRHGFAVLLIDLRDHGESTREDGHLAGGTNEYLDVLGAWDWLHTRGVPAERIGLYGLSMGAAAVTIAAGQEQNVAAVREDSGYASLDGVMQAEAGRLGLPMFLAASGLLMGGVAAGHNLLSPSPVEAVAALAPRAVEYERRLATFFAEALAAPSAGP